MATSKKDDDEKKICIKSIWLDANTLDGSEDSKKAQQKLTRNFGRCNFVTNTKDCEEVIQKSHGNAAYVLIVSGQIGSQFVREIHENPKYSSIYVYCGNVVSHKKWADEFTKVKLVSNDLDQLILKIRADHSSS